ncbi:MAG TPA: polymer-forming cytoskeletal protein, partial [Sphingobacteriaceae bacterium]
MIDRLLRSARKQPQETPAPEVIVAGGDYISHGSITITDTVTGDLYALNQALVEAEGAVKGNVFSTEAEIRGLVEGNILCRGCLRIRPSAVITGRIVAQSIEIDAGAVVNGSIALEERVHAQLLLEKVKQAARKDKEIDRS